MENVLEKISLDTGTQKYLCYYLEERPTYYGRTRG
jgi:hypothetical protein